MSQIQKGTQVNFREPVSYDETSREFKSVSWMGYILRLLPFYDIFEDKKVLEVLILRMNDKSRPLSERVQWANSAKTFDRHVLDRYWVSLSSDRKNLGHELYLSTLDELNLPQEVATKHPEFVKFLKVNHLDKMIKMQHHLLAVDKDSQEPMVLLEGEYKKWSEAKQIIFGNEIPHDLQFKEKGWTYLGASDFGKAGLVKYDSKEWEVRPGETEEKDGRKPRPFCKLTSEQLSQLKDAQGRQLELPYVENFVDCKAAHFPDRAIENNDHSFKKMIDTDGHVYYFGFSPKEEKTFVYEVVNCLATNKAVIESPDHYAYVPPAHRMSLIQQLTPKQFKDEFDYIVRMHNNGTTYNAFGNNCLELVIGADQAAGLKVPENKDLKIKFYKLFPKPLQFIYNWFPLPRFAKRWIMRSVMTVVGFNRGEKVDGVTLCAKEENSIWKDLTMSHPRKYLQYLKHLKAEDNALVRLHS